MLFTDRVDRTSPSGWASEARQKLKGPENHGGALLRRADEGVRRYVGSLVEFTYR
jgi:hypothetical protein